MDPFGLIFVAFMIWLGWLAGEVIRCIVEMFTGRSRR